MKKQFLNGDFKEFKAAVENKKAVLILCKTDNTFFGLLILNQIFFDQYNPSPMICAFNID
jgi:hypothetical protein